MCCNRTHCIEVVYEYSMTQCKMFEERRLNEFTQNCL